jgi:hypothetical protein
MDRDALRQHEEMFGHLPLHAVWRHVGEPDGFECAFFRVEDDLLVVEGQTIALDRDDVWSVGYSIRIDDTWRTRDARVAVRTARGVDVVDLERVGPQWFVDGQHAPELDGCDDLDLEASACTNTFPLHRLALPIGSGAEAPAVYVSAPDLHVGRLEQHYEHLDDRDAGSRYRYQAPEFSFETVIRFDGAGLVDDYPMIAERVR